MHGLSGMIEVGCADCQGERGRVREENLMDCQDEEGCCSYVTGRGGQQLNMMKHEALVIHRR